MSVHRLLSDKSEYSPGGLRYQLIQALNLCIISWLKWWKLYRRLRSFCLRIFLCLMNRLNFSPQWIIDHLPSPKTVRRYVNPKMGRDEFFKILNRRKVRYVVLRWFEDLPDWPPDEDMDLLIHDDDLSKIGDLFVRYPRTMPCDVYSVTAISAWNNLPYYPPHLAGLILRERILLKELYYVPCGEHHFLSLAYHVVFHKAEQSGHRLSKDVENSMVVSDHRYTEVLTKLAEQLGIQFHPNLHDMYLLLKDKGWTPPLGTFRKLAERSRWLSTLLAEKTNDIHDGELIIFTVREWAVLNNWMDFIMNWFEKKRDIFDVIKVKELDEHQRQLASDRIRGGTWGRGPYPVGGGRPAVFIVAFDHKPLPVPEDKKSKFPFIKNGHFFLKNEIRDEINKHLLRTRWVNCVHTSDDEIEAWEDLESISCPELIQDVREEIQKRRELMGR